MKNIIKKTIISLSFVSLIMVGFGGFALAELRPFEQAKPSVCDLIEEPATAQLAEEIQIGLASESSGNYLICAAPQPSDYTEQINEENKMGGN